MEPKSERPLSFASDGLGEEEWILEDRYGKCVPLRKTAMLFLGREACDITLKSRSVDGQHAVLVFDEFVERFKVKDLTSINGTFVNESRIPEDTYVYVEHADTLRFGYDSMVYRVISSSRAGRPMGDGSVESPQQQSPPSVSSPDKAKGRKRVDADTDLPSWAAREVEMESPTSCLEDQLLPPVMPAECSACMAENRMECHDCARQSATPREASNHSCGFSPLHVQTNGLPVRTRQETPPSSLALSTSSVGPAGDVMEEEAVSQLEQLRIHSPPGVTTPNHRATCATNCATTTGASSPSSRRKSVRELYGQPSWWGEADGDVYSYPHTASLAGQESRPADRPADRPAKPTVSPRPASAGPGPAPPTPTRPAEAFTVVFEKTTSPEEKKVESEPAAPPPAALSNFVPSKIRKSFQERQQERAQGNKARKTKPSTPDKTKTARPLSSSSRPNTRPSITGSSRRADSAITKGKPPTGKHTPPRPTKSQPVTPPTRPAASLRKSESTERLRSVEAFPDPKAYLFERMFDDRPSPGDVPVGGKSVETTESPGSEAGTYTIDREEEEEEKAYTAARVDVTRGEGDGGEEKAEVEAMEKEEEEMEEPQSVGDLEALVLTDEVEQEEIELKTSNTPKWLSELQQNQPVRKGKEGVTQNGDVLSPNPPSMPHAASSASLNSMPPMAMDGSGEYHGHRTLRGHHGTSYRHQAGPRTPRHHANSSGSSSGSNSSSVRQHKSTHQLAFAAQDADPVSPTGAPVHRTGSTVSLQLPPYSGKYPPNSRANRSVARDAYVADVIAATDQYNAMAMAYHNHQMQQAAHGRSASGTLTRKASESLIADVLSSRSVRTEDEDIMSASSVSMYGGPFYQQPMPPAYQHQHSVPGSYTTPRHYHRLSYHESTGGLSTYSLLDSRLPHDTAGLLQDTEEVLNDMQHRVMLHANAGHRARTAGSMDCIPYADEYTTDEDTPSQHMYGTAPGPGKRHSLSSHHYTRSSLDMVRRGSLPPSPGEPQTPTTSSAFRSPRSSTSTTGDGSSTKRSLGARIVEKSRENLQTSANSSASSSSTTVAQQTQPTTSPAAEQRDFGRHSLKLPTAACPGFTTHHKSPRLASSWQRRKEYDARKARQSSTGSLGSAPGQESGGSIDSGEAKPTELSKDLEVLARREELTMGGGRRSAFSPLHSSPDSPGTSTGQRSSQLPHGGFRSRSAAVLNDSSAGQTYDGLMVSSILHLSTKLRRCSNDILHKMKKSHHLSRTPSPHEDALASSTYSHVNQELSESLNNLKAVEFQMQVMERALFPQAKSGRSSALGSCTEGEYLMELERINHELKGFTPIDAPTPSIHSEPTQPVAPIPVSSANGSSYSSSVKNELYY